MTTVTVNLIPFGETPPGGCPWRVECHLTVCSDNRLQLRYNVQGPIKEQLVVPSQSKSPSRQVELWRHTCFECFLGVTGQTGYWEVNVSPSRDWAFYRLDDYRRGLVQDLTCDPHDIDIHYENNELSMQVKMQLPKDVPPDATFELSPTVVLEQINGQLTYWARVHPGEQPDFHDRRAFATIRDLVSGSSSQENAR